MPQSERICEESQLVDIQEFPEIEAFHKLPRRVIVKGGSSGLDASGKAKLGGIVINNTGHPIKDLKVCLIIFNEHEIPLLNASVVPDLSELPQGSIGSFVFTLDNYRKEIGNHYLYAIWKYDDSNF